MIKLDGQPVLSHPPLISFICIKTKAMAHKLIHWSKIWEIMQRRDAKGNLIPFQIKFAKRSTGEIVEYPVCYFTSIHTKGSTVNVMQEGEQRPRTIRRCLIVEFNHHKTYL